MENTHEPVHKPEVGHEERDTNIRAILWFALSLALTIIVVMVLMKLLFGVLPSPGPATASMSSVQASELPPEPRLQVNAPEDLRKMRAREDSVLESYGWINKQDGIVRIPIDRAMDLLGQRGLPPFPQPPAKPRVK